MAWSNCTACAPGLPPMWHELLLLLMAAQALTRLPAPAWVGDEPRARRDSLRHWPAVGLLLGGAGALVLWLAAHAWPSLVSVLLSVAAMLWLTGARHEAAMVGETLAVPRLLALLALLALKVAVLQGLAARDLLATLAVLPLAQAWSRAALVLLLRLQPPAEAAARVDGLGFALATMWAALAAAAAAPFMPAPALAGAALAAVLGTLALARGPATPARQGALQQGTELLVYGAVLALLVRG
jgi:adenosylcobinamide-GDP ribazoletransferase